MTYLYHVVVFVKEFLKPGGQQLSSSYISDDTAEQYDIIPII